MKQNAFVHVLFVLALISGSANAGIFDNPENLKVLPEDISPQELGATMKGIAMGLGLRCSKCHMGEEGQDLAEYDFSSDEKELKQKARKMLKMVRAINNDFLDEINPDHVQVQCVTCHRGVREPKLLGQVLAEAADEDGTAAVRESYFALKERYFGAHSYDFSERGLSTMIRNWEASRDQSETTTLLDIMLEEYPQSFMGYFMYGEVEREAGNIEAATAHYEKALELNPQAVFIQGRLEQLQQPSAEN